MLSSEEKRPRANSGRILIVDDEAALRFFIAHFLLELGWEVAEADRGEIALALLAERPFDVVLLDLRMAGIGGVQTMQEIKRKWPTVMVVIMTAYASLDSAVEAVRAGAFDYLQKPCDSDRILDAINRALAAKRRLAHRRPSVKPQPPAKRQTPTPTKFETGDLRIHVGLRRAWLAGQLISLTPTEYELLSLLAHSLGEVVAVEALVRDGLGHGIEDRQAQETLRVHISRLRQKVGADYIQTGRGGYALVALSPQEDESRTGNIVVGANPSVRPEE